MQFKIITLAALAGMASAYFQPDTKQLPSGNPIHTPNNEIVPGGKPFKITWTPTTPGKVSILLLQGPGTNVQYLATIADSIDNSGSYTWNVDPSLKPKDTEYAIEIVSENHSYQYSSQIGISKAEGVSVSPSASGSSTSYGSVETAPPSSSAVGTAVCGALDECAKTTAAATGATGTQNVTSPVITPTVPMSVPSSLVKTTVAAGGAATTTSVVAVGAGGNGGSSQSAGAAATSALSSAFAAPGAKLSGAAAAVAGLLGLLVL